MTQHGIAKINRRGISRIKTANQNTLYKMHNSAPPIANRTLPSDVTICLSKFIISTFLMGDTTHDNHELIVCVSSDVQLYGARVVDTLD